MRNGAMGRVTRGSCPHGKYGSAEQEEQHTGKKRAHFSYIAWSKRLNRCENAGTPLHDGPMATGLLRLSRLSQRYRVGARWETKLPSRIVRGTHTTSARLTRS